ncbi:MAG: hypothetical protein V1735_01495 [Nanoarchaeota archaeon]
MSMDRSDIGAKLDSRTTPGISRQRIALAGVGVTAIILAGAFSVGTFLLSQEKHRPANIAPGAVWMTSSEHMGIGGDVAFHSSPHDVNQDGLDEGVLHLYHQGNFVDSFLVERDSSGYHIRKYIVKGDSIIYVE